MTARESESQRRAAEAVGRVLARRLRLYECEPGGDDSLDYIDEHNEVYEMKLVTSEEFVEIRKRRLRWFPSTKLGKHWSVLLEAPTMGDKFRQMPDFADDDAETIAALEAEGFTVVRKAEREAAWRERFSGRKLAIPRIGRREAGELELRFLVLEHGGIANTRGAEPQTSEEREALWAIRRLTHGAICVAHEPFGDGPGIEIRVGWGYPRTGDPNALAFRVQAWLDSHLGSNLRLSLRQGGFAGRHAVLSFDASEPEFWSAQEAGVAFVPTLALTLPAEIKVLWCLIGSILLRYESEQDWQSFAVSS